MERESRFREKLINELEEMFEGCLIMHTDPQDIQGMPDLIILYGTTWAGLETKRHEGAHRQPNQPYYVDLLNKMSFAAFIYPENKEEVLYELQKTFRARRATRISRR